MKLKFTWVILTLVSFLSCLGFAVKGGEEPEVPETLFASQVGPWARVSRPPSNPEPVLKKPGKPTKLETTWQKGIYFQSEDQKYSMRFRIQIQPQFEFQTRSRRSESNRTSFRIRRLNLTWAGTIFTPDLSYSVQLSPAARDWEDVLGDVYLEYHVWDALKVRVGQFDVPYNHQQSVSSGRLKLVNRSIASEEFQIFNVDRKVKTICQLSSGERISGEGIECDNALSLAEFHDRSRSVHEDIGVLLQGDFLKKRLSYYFSLTNGSGANRPHLNSRFSTTGRLVWNVLGQYDYFSETDLAPSGNWALMAGIAGNHHREDFSDRRVMSFGGELGFRYKDFSMQGDYYLRNTHPPENMPSFNDHGYYVQAGYLFFARRFEVAARLSQVFLGEKGNHKNEWNGGINYYLIGHDLKFQSDYSYLTFEQSKESRNEHRVRVQMQAWF